MTTSTAHRLRKHADFQRVYKAGRKQFSKQIGYFHALRSEQTQLNSATLGPRIGLTVPKALGKAVDRNRIKRRMREAVRHALPLLSAPVDLVLHGKVIARGEVVVVDGNYGVRVIEVASPQQRVNSL